MARYRRYGLTGHTVAAVPAREARPPIPAPPHHSPRPPPLPPLAAAPPGHWAAADRPRPPPSGLPSPLPLLSSIPLSPKAPPIPRQEPCLFPNAPPHPPNPATPKHSPQIPTASPIRQNSGVFQTAKLLFPGPHETTASVAGSSTISYVLIRKGGGAVAPLLPGARPGGADPVADRRVRSSARRCNRRRHHPRGSGNTGLHESGRSRSGFKRTVKS